MFESGNMLMSNTVGINYNDEANNDEEDDGAKRKSSLPISETQLPYHLKTCLHMPALLDRMTGNQVGMWPILFLVR